MKHLGRHSQEMAAPFNSSRSGLAESLVMCSVVLSFSLCALFAIFGLATGCHHHQHHHQQQQKWVSAPDDSKLGLSLPPNSLCQLTSIDIFHCRLCCSSSSARFVDLCLAGATMTTCVSSPAPLVSVLCLAVWFPLPFAAV